MVDTQKHKSSHSHPKKSGHLIFIAYGAFGLSVLLALALFSSPGWLPSYLYQESILINDDEDPDQQNYIQKLSNRLIFLEEKIIDLENQIEITKTEKEVPIMTSAFIDELKEKVETLNSDFQTLKNSQSELQQTVSNPARSEDIEAIGQTITSLKSALKNHFMMMSALHNLKKAFNMTKPYEAELQAIDTLSNSHFAHPPILDQFATRGLMSDLKIQKEFQEVLNALIEIDYTTDQTGWKATLNKRLKQLIKIKPNAENQTTLTSGQKLLLELSDLIDQKDYKQASALIDTHTLLNTYPDLKQIKQELDLRNAADRFLNDVHHFQMQNAAKDFE